ncbi:hypothetical protein M513_12491 [Trichuris suis]|uniref:DUF7047 domain-containing protein n=1 Tax=Trichuris suis TaxID=68888 RepID=A0A085LNU0_9BILA|nr:hypothetical protein M513_12491 [Trichuris suis]
MKAVVGHVLSLTPHLRRGTSAIFVNQLIVSAETVKRHLVRYGLVCKDPERVTDGARVLGLKVWGEQGALLWARGKEISGPPKTLTTRTEFSYCGELVGHYPMCGWLRAASAFAKREGNGATERWDEPIHEDRIRAQLIMPPLCALGEKGTHDRLCSVVGRVSTERHAPRLRRL